MLTLLGLSCLILACNSTVTFYGQSVDEYVSKSSNNYDLYPAAIQRRWQLASINDDPASFGLALSDNIFFLYFTTRRVNKERYQYEGKVMQSFWGEYSFDEEGTIEILMMRGNEENLLGSAGKLERLFERIAINAKTYEIIGATMNLSSSTGVLEFALPPSKISY